MARGALVPGTLSLDEVGRQIENWRRLRPHRTMMPEDLWQAAAAVARTRGIHPVARALRLDYYALKRRLDSRAAAAFVEVTACPPPAECLVEMEHPDGGRMRLRLSSEDALVRLGEAFWRRRA